MHIPRPAKLLFQYDDGWNRFIDNNPVDEWQLLCVEKIAVPAASKAPNSGLPSSAIFCRIASSNISPSRCPICFDLSSTITGPCSTNSFAVQPAPCSNMPGTKASKLAFFVPYILMVASSINIPIFMCR